MFPPRSPRLCVVFTQMEPEPVCGSEVWLWRLGHKKHCSSTSLSCIASSVIGTPKQTCGEAQTLRYLPTASTHLPATPMSPLGVVTSFHPFSSLWMTATPANIWLFLRNSASTAQPSCSHISDLQKLLGEGNILLLLLSFMPF